MTESATILRQEVERAGAISLARFMELALYCPESGYYEARGCNAPRIGRNGDFYTSVSVGNLFGQLLAFQFDSWLEGDEKCEVRSQRGEGIGARTSHFAPLTSRHLVEAGAHDGRLAFDILDWFKQHRPGLLDGLEYWLVEPSPQQQAWQQTRLEPFAKQVRWTQSIQSLPTGGVQGIIFSNELLDAFPVHRLVWHRASRKWIEWGVGMATEDGANGQFVWRPLPGLERDWSAELTQAGLELSPELQEVLPDGFILDLCPLARTWWRQAAAALRRGRLLTIDYGLSAQQFLSPERSHGTLRAYRRHQMIRDVLANPGEQDLTSHVNFTQLQKAGEDEGLKTDGLLTQAQFLTPIAGRMWSASNGALASSQTRQFQTFTHPEHLGRSFRVLIQSRNG